MVNGTDIGSQEWRVAIFIQQRIKPPDLPHHCNGCRVGLNILHAPGFKKGGLITFRHNKLWDWVSDLDRKYLTSNHMRNYHLINPGHDVRSRKAFLDKSHSPNSLSGIAIDSDQKGALIIRDLCERGN